MVADEVDAVGVRRASWVLPVALLLAGVGVGVAIVAPQTQSATGLLDLRIYVGSARAVALGGSAYTFTDATYHLGSTYPPLWSRVVAPVSGLDIHGLEYGWTFLNLVFLLATVWVVGNGFTRVGPRLLTSNQVLVVWLASIPSAAVWNTLNQGQVNLLVWLLLAVDLQLVLRGRRLQGVLIGLCGALKLVPLTAAALLFLARRRRAALAAVLSFVGVTALVAVLAPDDSRTYWTSLVFDTGRVGALSDPQSVSVRSLVARFGVTGGLATGIWLVVSGAAVAVAGTRVRLALDRGAPIAAAVLVGSAMALASPISWTHHLVFLPLLLALAVPATAARGRWREGAWFVVLAVVLIDPVGFGRSAITSSLTTVLLVGLLLAGRSLVEVEMGRRSGGRGTAEAVPLSLPATTT